MEIIEYKIKKGDTLESIAEEYNISVEELVNFHNKNCGITQQIIRDRIPLHITFVLLNQNTKKKGIERNIISYRIKSNNEYYNFKKIVHSTNNEIKISIEKLDENKFSIKQFSKIINCKSPNYDNLLILLALLDRPFENVVLSTDDFGNIISIDNQKEIENEWEIVKSELNDVTEDKELLSNLFEDEKKVFAKSLEHIKANIQFNLLFPGKFNVKDSVKINEGPTVNLYSSLFSGTKITIRFKNKILFKEDNIFEIENKAFFDKKNETILKDLYDETFRELLGNNFFYDFQLKSKYRINQGIIESCESDFIENINDTMVSKSTYKIEKIYL